MFNFTALKHQTVLLSTLCVAVSMPVLAQSPVPPGRVTAQPPASPVAAPVATPVATPVDYVIGVADVLKVVFAPGPEMSHDALVRPDGKISLPLIGDVQAANLTPVQLASEVTKAGRQYVLDARATVIVTAINSRRIYVVGEVGKPGPVQLASDITVLQAIGEAGGFVEGANKGDVTIVRRENNRERRYKFNYNEVVRGKNIEQNIKLLPGDTILVR
jgi:polysaccharide export outer membrane protein